MISKFTQMSLMILALFIGTFDTLGQTVRPANRATVTRENGGSIQTPLGYGITLNKESSLTREWVTVHDNSLPVKMNGTVGIKTIYEPGKVRGEFNYSTKYTIDVQEPIAAIEIRFLLFDIWGNHIRTLNQTEIADIKATKELSGKWSLYSENEASEFYASIAYISRIRTQSGRVIEGDTVIVLEEARKLSKKFLPENLEPKTEKK